MSDILTKEQIDQLLSGSGFTDAGKKPAEPNEPLRKIGDLFCKQAAAVLTTALNRKVSVTLVSSEKGNGEALRSDFGENALSCTVPVSGKFDGSFWYLIGKKTAATAGDLMMMQEPKGVFGAEHLDATVELTNQLFSSFATAYTAELGSQLQIGQSQATDFLIDSPPCPLNGCTVLAGRISIEGAGDGPFGLLVADALAGMLVPPGAPAAGPVPPVMEQTPTVAPLQFVETRESADAPHRAVAAAKGPRNGKDNIDLLLDIDLDVSIELGNSTLSIKRILELAPGSIIELDRMAGEPVDLLVNNKVVAKGEVVVIDESFGIRILSLVSPEERIKILR